MSLCDRIQLIRTFFPLLCALFFSLFSVSLSKPMCSTFFSISFRCEFQKYVCYYNCNNKFHCFFLHSFHFIFFALRQLHLERDLLCTRVDTWHGIHLYAIVIYAGWQIICIKIPLKQAEHDVMHRNACIEDASKRWGMKSLNVSTFYRNWISTFWNRINEHLLHRTAPFATRWTPMVWVNVATSD